MNNNNLNNVQGDSEITGQSEINSQITDKSQLLQKDDEQNQYQLISNTNWKFLFLFAICQINTGIFYFLNLPGLIKDNLKNDLKINEDQYSLMLSVSQIPTIILAFGSGYLIDIIGYRYGVFFSLLIAYTSMLMMTFAGYLNSYKLMFGALFLYYFSVEWIGVTQMALVSKWFKGKQLALAIALTQTNIRVAEIISSWTVVPLYDIKNQLYLPLFVASFIALYSLCVCGTCVIIMDKKLDQQKLKLSASQIKDVQKIKLSDIKSFPLLYWLIAVNYSFASLSFTTFNLEVNNVMQQNFGISKTRSGQLFSIVFFVGFVCPFIGAAIDQFGKRPLFLIISSVFLLLMFIFWAILPHCDQGSNCPIIYPIIPLVMEGIFISIGAVNNLACINPLIKQSMMGSAFGLVFSIKDISLSAGPYLMGVIIDKYEYQGLVVFLSFLACYLVLQSFFVLFYDKYRNESKLYKYKKKM